MAHSSKFSSEHTWTCDQCGIQENRLVDKFEGDAKLPEGWGMIFLVMADEPHNFFRVGDGQSYPHCDHKVYDKTYSKYLPGQGIAVGGGELRRWDVCGNCASKLKSKELLRVRAAQIEIPPIEAPTKKQIPVPKPAAPPEPKRLGERICGMFDRIFHSKKGEQGGLP